MLSRKVFESFFGDGEMKRSLCLFALMAVGSFVLSSGGSAQTYSGPCTWKYSTLITGCHGTDSPCNQGCNQLCNGLSGVQYSSPRNIESSGNLQSSNYVQLNCKLNKNCGNYAVGSRKCTYDVNGGSNCNTVDVTDICSYCQVTSSSYVGVWGYDLRACPGS